MAELHDNEEYGFVDVPVPPLPVEDRKRNQFRQLAMRLSFLDKVPGSGYVEFGQTCVLCSIEGPLERDREAEDELEDDRAIRIISEDLNDEYLVALDQIVDTFVRTDLLVNVELKIHIKVVSDDGGILAAAAMAAGLALTSAKIEMFDTILAATVLFESNTSTVPTLDPTADQCRRARENGGGYLTIVTLPAFDQIGHILLEGIFTSKQMKIATEAAFQFSLSLYEQTSTTIKESL